MFVSEKTIMDESSSDSGVHVFREASAAITREQDMVELIWWKMCRVV